MDVELKLVVGGLEMEMETGGGTGATGSKSSCLERRKGSGLVKPWPSMSGLPGPVKAGEAKQSYGHACGGALKCWSNWWRLAQQKLKLARRLAFQGCLVDQGTKSPLGPVHLQPRLAPVWRPFGVRGQSSPPQ